MLVDLLIALGLQIIMKISKNYVIATKYYTDIISVHCIL